MSSWNQTGPERRRREAEREALLRLALEDDPDVLVATLIWASPKLACNARFRLGWLERGRVRRALHWSNRRSSVSWQDVIPPLVARLGWPSQASQLLCEGMDGADLVAYIQEAEAVGADIGVAGSRVPEWGLVAAIQATEPAENEGHARVLTKARRMLQVVRLLGTTDTVLTACRVCERMGWFSLDNETPTILVVVHGLCQRVRWDEASVVQALQFLSERTRFTEEMLVALVDDMVELSRVAIVVQKEEEVWGNGPAYDDWGPLGYDESYLLGHRTVDEHEYQFDAAIHGDRLGELALALAGKP